jgi:DNA-binding PadR family transcriptional regulator
MKLTQTMRSALVAASKQPLRRVFKGHGKPPWPAHPSTIYALLRRGFLECSEIRNRQDHPTVLWTITPNGLEALKPVAKVKAERALFLTAKPQHVKADYTCDPSRAMRGEPEAVRSEDIDQAWFGAAARRLAGATDRRAAARRARRAA